MIRFIKNFMLASYKVNDSFKRLDGSFSAAKINDTTRLWYCFDNTYITKNEFKMLVKKNNISSITDII